MREHLERELKLVPEDGFRLSDLGEPLAPRVFVSTYHDTPDFRLARHGITLRHRAEDGTRLWQLKIPTGSARIELEVPGPPARPPAEMTDLLVVHLHDRALEKVARLRTRRQSVLRDGAEIVEDAVSVFEAQRVVKRFREIEVELLDGDEQALERLERKLTAAGAKSGTFLPKLFRALDLSFDGAEHSVERGESPGATLGIALVEQRRKLIDHDPGTRLGADPENLHQMRVATRRARAFLRAARGLVEPDWAEELRAELGWLGSVLGAGRDADVLLERMTGAVESLTDSVSSSADLLAALEEERDRARGAVVAGISEDRYFALLGRLEEAEEPRLLEASDVTLAGLWWKEHKRTKRTFRRLGSGSSDEELHEARIRVKRARYAAELAGHELGRAGERYVDAAKKLQDILGEHQDSVVAEEWIAAWAERNPEGDALAAALVERERELRDDARRAWPKSWDKLARKARKARV